METLIKEKCLACFGMGALRKNDKCPWCNGNKTVTHEINQVFVNVEKASCKLHKCNKVFLSENESKTLET